MPTPVNIQSELVRHQARNAEQVRQLVEEQYNTEITRGFALEFSSGEEGDAVGLGRLLFAKGLRLLQPEPTEEADGRWWTRVGVKRSLREVTAEDFVCNLVTLASGVHSCFETWDFLADDAAEATQPHPDHPDPKGHAA